MSDEVLDAEVVDGSTVDLDQTVFTFSEPESNFKNRPNKAEKVVVDADDSTDSSDGSGGSKRNNRRGRKSKEQKQAEVREASKPLVKQVVGIYAGVGSMVLGQEFLPTKDEFDSMTVALEDWFVEMGIEGNLPAWVQVVMVFGVHAGTRLANPVVRQRAINLWTKMKGGTINEDAERIDRGAD